MSDIALTWNGTAADFSIFENDLATDAGLETAVLISLFTDRRLEDNDEPPDGDADRRGWWGDALLPAGDKIGSRLWTLKREKQAQIVLTRMREFALEALDWMVVDQVAREIQVTTEIVRTGMAGMTITILRPKLAPLFRRRYDYVWAAQLLRRP